MTWKDFKQQVEAAGVQDTDEIDWIDMAGMDGLFIKRKPYKDTFEVTISSDL